MWKTKKNVELWGFINGYFCEINNFFRILYESSCELSPVKSTATVFTISMKELKKCLCTEIDAVTSQTCLKDRNNLFLNDQGMLQQIPTSS